MESAGELHGFPVIGHRLAQLLQLANEQLIAVTGIVMTRTYLKIPDYRRSAINEE